ncbi:MAG: aspartate-semialdehyde dehydrogenase [Bacteroidales bacterium]|nr:aspartate-semialdehyde dehydrogenase [Bacteroidales bacterium]
MKVAVIGATGLVGTKMLEVLAERNFPADEILPAASAKSIGRTVYYKGKPLSVLSTAEVLAAKPDIALFSAGSAASLELAPEFAKAGCRVVDNSSCWRTDPLKKLIVPEINGDILEASDYIIANPNCSTIQMLLPLAPLHKEFRIKRIVVSTYQSVTGSGYKGVSQLEAEREGAEWGSYATAYPCQIDLNVIPQIGDFGEDGNSQEETKMINETHKILNDNSIGVSVTTVRVPVRGGHSEAVNLEFERPFKLEDVKRILYEAPGVTLLAEGYPVPRMAEGRDDVFVGRLRRDSSVPNGLNLWCVSDNLRKGAATNAVQIAELLYQRFLVR